MQEQSVVKSIGSCTMLQNGLTFSGVVSFEEWSKRGKEIATIINLYNSHIAWWLGDWIIYGENNYKEKYSQALESTMYSIGTLRNCVYVCRNVKLEDRNHALSFQHHYEVAPLDAQDQRDWLAKAEVNRWTAKQLRAAIRGFKTEEKIEVNDSEEDIASNAISHTKPGQSFEDWWTREGHAVKLLNVKEAAYAGWMSGILSRAKQA